MNIVQRSLGILLLVSYGFFASAALSHDVFQKIDEDAIAAYQQKIADDFKKYTYRKVGLMVSSIALGTYVLYTLSQDTTPSILTQSAPIALEQKELLELCLKQRQHIAEQQVINKGTLDLLAEQGIGKSTTWGIWFKRLGHQLKNQYTFAAMGAVATATLSPLLKYLKSIDKLVDKGIDFVFPAGDMNWFLETRCTIMPLLNELHDYTKIQTDALITESSPFVATWQLCAQQLEAMIGFIRYKASLFASNNQIHGTAATTIADELLSRVQDYRNRLEQAWHHPEYTTRIATLNVLIEELKAKVIIQIQRFTQLEALIVY